MAVADRFSEFINTQTVCSSGCSHCCYQAVAVNTREARIIADYIGRAPKKIDDSYETYLLNNAFQEKYKRTACTFLVDGRCSIYAVRPVVCRIHHSIEDSPENCDTIKTAPVGVMNAHGIIHAFYNIPFDGVSDIREYFPKEST